MVVPKINTKKVTIGTRTNDALRRKDQKLQCKKWINCFQFKLSVLVADFWDTKISLNHWYHRVPSTRNRFHKHRCENKMFANNIVLNRCEGYTDESPFTPTYYCCEIDDLKWNRPTFDSLLSKMNESIWKVILSWTYLINELKHSYLTDYKGASYCEEQLLCNHLVKIISPVLLGMACFEVGLDGV